MGFNHVAFKQTHIISSVCVLLFEERTRINEMFVVSSKIISIENLRCMPNRVGKGFLVKYVSQTLFYSPPISHVAK